MTHNIKTYFLKNFFLIVLCCSKNEQNERKREKNIVKLNFKILRIILM